MVERSYTPCVRRFPPLVVPDIVNSTRRPERKPLGKWSSVAVCGMKSRLVQTIV